MENKYKKYQERLLPRHNLRCKLMASSPETGFYYPLIKWGNSKNSQSVGDEAELVAYLISLIDKMDPISKIIGIDSGNKEKSDMFRHEHELMKLFDAYFESFSNKDEIYEQIMLGNSDYWVPSEIDSFKKYFKPKYHSDNILRLFEQELNKPSARSAIIELSTSGKWNEKLTIHNFLPVSHIPVYVTGELAKDFLIDAIEYFTRNSHPVFRVLLADYHLKGYPKLHFGDEADDLEEAINSGCTNFMFELDDEDESFNPRFSSFGKNFPYYITLHTGHIENPHER
jgi:hypothetical protein